MILVARVVNILSKHEVVGGELPLGVNGDCDDYQEGQYHEEGASNLEISLILEIEKVFAAPEGKACYRKQDLHLD